MTTQAAATVQPAPFKTLQEEKWELGGEILEQGAAHPSLACVGTSWQDVLKALGEIQEQSKGLKRFGVGRTEDPTLILARVVPALRSLSETAALIADQLEGRLKGA